MQRIFLLRHGQGLHNVRHEYDMLDPGLTTVGKRQAEEIRGHRDLIGCDLLVVSALSRAVETAAIVFGESPRCRVVITSMHSERCYETCDEGRPKSELKCRYPFISNWEGFENLSEDWTHKKDADFDWKEKRVPVFRSWLQQQPERHIVCVGHGSFFEAMCGKHLNNCEITETSITGT